MQWILGVDLSERHHLGPIHLARWLVDETAAGSESVRPVHIIEGDQLGMLAGTEFHNRATELARERAHQALKETNAEIFESGLEILADDNADHALGKLAKDAKVDGLVIGRRAPRGKDSLMRLGRVARRLLRSLPVPVLVAPPDLQREQIGGGPVVVAVDFTEASAAACRYGRRLAKALGRELVLSHIVPMPYGWSVGYLPKDAIEQVQRDLQATGERELEHWANQNGFTHHRAFVRQGLVPEEILAIAGQENACILVSGSRKLSAPARVFATSVGTELAASATCPVAIVPADERVQ